MFGHTNPLRNKLSPKILALPVDAGFYMQGDHNQRQSFFRKVESQGKKGMQRIEIVENAPSDLVVIYESATEYGDTIEARIKIEAPSLLEALEKAVAHAEESFILAQFHGLSAMNTA